MALLQVTGLNTTYTTPQASILSPSHHRSFLEINITYNKALIGAILAFLSSLILLFAIWQYQRRTLTWNPVEIEITSSEIAYSREKRRGRVWTANVNYSVEGTAYSKTIHDLPFNAKQIYVDPNDPTNVVGERGGTIRALFIPILAVAATGLFTFVLGLIKFSPSDD